MLGYVLEYMLEYKALPFFPFRAFSYDLSSFFFSLSGGEGEAGRGRQTPASFLSPSSEGKEKGAARRITPNILADTT